MSTRLILEEIQPLQPEMQSWRQDLHRIPELNYEEVKTQAYVIEKLKSFGLEVHSGLGGTGVVASVRKGSSKRSIALRADMDGLPIEELNDLPYKSTHQGKMHACGHDGHMAMLLGAAKYLSKSGDFDGTVHFIFQPAEEGGAGAKKMIDEGLFTAFPAERVYGLHNIPGLPFGEFNATAGPIMAITDELEIVFTGVGGHAAMPHACTDAVEVAARFVGEAQSIVSRVIDPNDPAVISITTFHAGDAFNVIPGEARLSGTVRCFSEAVRESIKDHLQKLGDSLGAARGVSFALNYLNGYPATVNTPEASKISAEAARRITTQAVHEDASPSMGGEDFAYMLQEKAGCYVWLGTQGDYGLHNARFDFNDKALSLGAAYWVSLTELELKAA